MKGPTDMIYKKNMKSNMFVCMFLLLLASCVPPPPESKLAYQLESFIINGRDYNCWNQYDLHLRAERILLRIAEIAKDELPVAESEAISRLMTSPVGLCQLPYYLIYEFCGGLESVGCYFFPEMKIWITANSLVHELFHHFIAVVYDTPDDMINSSNHVHNLQTKYQSTVKEEFSL